MKRITFIISFLITFVSLQAQDYLINFAGSGASSIVNSVKVENLSQYKSITINGTDLLHLVVTSTAINPLKEIDNSLAIYPNPAKDKCSIEFFATANGKANVELFDITGKRISAAQNTLTIGSHSFQISGLKSAIYTIRISSQKYTYTGTFVGNGGLNSKENISYSGKREISYTAQKLKSTKAEKTMQYSKGDRLKFTGTSGNYNTIITDIPTQSKTINFGFVACTDADGNNYPVVQIGNQVWMAENLKTTKYNDGTGIQNITDNAAWSELITGAYCWYNNDISYKDIFGALYNFYTVKTEKLAPTGWHIPRGMEWITLLTYLENNGYGYQGSGNDIGKSLAATFGWYDYSTPGTVGNDQSGNNGSGFTAFPGGTRSNNGTFNLYKIYGSWWSSTVASKTDAPWYWILTNTSDVVYRYNTGKMQGCSVRCLLNDLNSDVVLPTLSTKPQSYITKTSATSGGTISSDGGADITECGVCWSTSHNPTIADHKTTDSSDLCNFTSSITGLTANTNYYVRAYASNAVGTSYGNEISLKTSGGTVTDIDGNVYHTIMMGTQEWMLENLKTTRYNDGTSIPNVIDNTAWGALTTGAYCCYENDISNKTIFGVLYNWYAVNTEKLAPAGWHVPSREEWTTLTDYLKRCNYTDDGFSGITSGYRMNEGKFYNLSIFGYWWSTTQAESGNAYYWSKLYHEVYISNSTTLKVYGQSVRCIKD